MTDHEDDRKIIPLHPPKREAVSPDDHPVTQALKRAGPIAEAPEEAAPDPFAGHRPNRLAIGAMIGMSLISFVAAYLTPTTADDGLKFSAAMAMVWGFIAMAAALLYRYGREFWIAPKR